MNLGTFERFEKQIILKKIGLEGQKKIFASSVLIVGLGGLGCPLLYYLSASSAGSLTKTPPTTASHYVTLVGEAGTSNQLVLKIKRPIQLR